MKKKVKIILTCIIGVLALVGIFFAVDYATSSTDANATGTLVEGGGEYDWVKYEVHISQENWDYTRYYTHCDGDYITNIYYQYDSYFGRHKIEYAQNFTCTDDLDTCVVLQRISDGKTIVSDIETSHTDWGYDEIDVYDEGGGYKAWFIKEIWVRTVD